MRQLFIPELVEKLQPINVDRNDRYILTYPSYLSYFSALRQISKDDILRGIGFVYSWMPRVMTIDPEEIESFALAANNLRSNAGEDHRIRILRSAIKLTQGSVVASSKLLHFIIPELFAIYDSHIYRYCWDDDKGHHYNVKKPSNYDKYMDALTGLRNNPSMNHLRNLVTEKLGYHVEDLRAIEFSIFQISKSQMRVTSALALAGLDVKH